MSYVNNIIKCIENGIHKFISVCINANRDLPFHDFKIVESAGVGSYCVGTNQVKQSGDQKKRFVSKSTLILSTINANIQFNSANNVVIAILANTWYEFKSNIYEVFWEDAFGQASIMFMYFEGVMVNEARSPE